MLHVWYIKKHPKNIGSLNCHKMLVFIYHSIEPLDMKKTQRRTSAEDTKNFITSPENLELFNAGTAAMCWSPFNRSNTFRCDYQPFVSSQPTWLLQNVNEQRNQLETRFSLSNQGARRYWPCRALWSHPATNSADGLERSKIENVWDPTSAKIMPESLELCSSSLICLLRKARVPHAQC